MCGEVLPERTLAVSAYARARQGVNRWALRTCMRVFSVLFLKERLTQSDAQICLACRTVTEFGVGLPEKTVVVNVSHRALRDASGCVRCVSWARPC